MFARDLTVIDFEMFPDGTPVPYRSASLSNQWASLGLVISDSTAFAAASAYDGVVGQPPHSGTRGISVSSDAPGGYVTISFVVPGTREPGLVTDVGVWIENNDTDPSTVTFLGANKEVLQTIQTFGHDFFASYSNPAGISALIIDAPDYFLGDDLQFSPVFPVPVTAYAIGGGDLIACWPAAYSTYVLQVAHHINQREPEKTKWTFVSGSAVLAGDTLCLTNRISEGRFFRLVPRE